MDTTSLVERAIFAEHAECRHVAQLLSRMTMTQRRKVCRLAYTTEHDRARLPPPVKAPLSPDRQAMADLIASVVLGACSLRVPS